MTLDAPSPQQRTDAIDDSQRKANVLLEALPYIRRFRGKCVVIKYGGSAMVDDKLRDTFAGDVGLLSMVGIRTVVVHGGGPQITRAMKQAGVEPRWVGGLRVTDAETMRVVQTTLAGEINPDIVRLLAGHGANAVGITGLDSNLFNARPRDKKLGFVGEIETVDPRLITSLLDQDMVPVVVPLARGTEDGATYNLNADTAAGALAAALHAEKLVYLTDVEGLYRDFSDAQSLISRIALDELRGVVKEAASSGMLPKLQSCIAAMEQGVQQAHILDGRVQHALLLEIFTPEGVGTMITSE